MAEERKYSRSLQRRLVITILVASSALTTLFTAISFYMDYRVEVSSLEATFESIQHSSVKNITESLYDFDVESVKTQINGITGIRDIMKVVVLGEDGKVYAEAYADPAQGAVLSYVGLEKIFNERRTLKIYPLFNPKVPTQQIGVLSVEASQRNMFVRLSNKAIYFFLTQGLKTLIVSLIIIWIFQVLVTQHMKRIVEYLGIYDFQADQAGDPLALDRVPPRRPDELDAMVDTVNTLSTRLHYFNSRMQQQFHLKDQEVRDQRAIASNVVKLATLGEMAGGIAHEINNPLHIIKGYNDILVDQLGQGIMDREVLHRASLVIDKNTNRIARIVSSLLMFSRKGDQEIFELISLSKLIDQVVSITQPLAENHGIRFEVDVEELDELLRVECSQVQIAQVLINLINNAIDAIVDQDRADPWIRVAGHGDHERVRIEVIDCGEGIPDAVATKIFEPFFTTKEVGKGTGLGLSMSLGIVEQHRGRLYLDKQKFNTCFVIELPLEHQKTRKAS
ncbi:MAG TPA: ATP-binding protein [Oligoflexus sp.]|nr:ATP-binding protein [Oligoflexus sp.]